MHLLLRIFTAILLLGSCRAVSGGEIQFDVFVGYDGVVRPAAWNPLVVELLNEGPSRDCVLEVSSDRWSSATVRVPIELPTNSRKRLTVPFFCTGVGVECRLLGRDGRVLAQKPPGSIQVVRWNAALVGSLAASSEGGPSIPGDGGRDAESDRPRVVRLRAEMFPDSALSLESLSSIYVGPSKASALGDGQITALLQWVACGGQLIVGLDRPGDYASLPFLRKMGVSIPQGDGRPVTEAGMRHWMDQGSWNPEFAFRSRTGAVGAQSDEVTSIGRTGSGRWIKPLQTLSFGAGREPTGVDGGTPWMDVRAWGRGQVVVLGFDPEREPMRSWDGRTRFWSKLMAIPTVTGATNPTREPVLTGLDMLFADLVDTRQVRKLPISILMALLVLYLAMVGPGDRWLLGRLGRPMLTWLTFPAYVLLFSGLIYLIGYRLRSGQTEWNELQIIDVIPTPSGGSSVLRCRTYGGLYSPATGIYPIELGVPSGGIRSELRNLFGVRLDSGRVMTTLSSRETSADIQASLWMKNLVVTEWMDNGEAPIVVLDRGDGRHGIRNQTGKQLGPIWLVHGGRVRVVEDLEPGGVLDWSLGGDSRSLDEVLEPVMRGVSESMNPRDQPAGGSDVDSKWNSSLTMASGFGGRVDISMPADQSILWPRGFDLTGGMDSGRLLVLAWVSNPGLMPPLNRFPAARGARQSLLRLTVPLSTRP